MDARSGPGRQAKRAVDVAVSSVALVLAAPAILVGGLAILWEDGWPVFFRQRRVGAGGREFDVVKLRSMRVHSESAEDVGQVLAGNPLLTRVGRLLRRSHVDELPQLVQVWRGHMSLVGPRPTLPSQVAGYDSTQRRRLEVAPGMTGWAQVNGNVLLDWSDRIALDVWYIDHWSPWLDLRILLRTLRVVVSGERVDEAQVEVARSYARGAGGDG